MAPPLALTLGEPAGIGPEIVLLAWRARAAAGLPAFCAVGDPDLLCRRAAALGLDVPVVACTASEAEELFEHALPVHPNGVAATAAPGHPDESSAPSVLQSLEQAVHLVRAGIASALVTAPLAKSVLYRADFPFPGHTEYLAAQCAAPGTLAPRPVMMIWSPLLAVVPATIHVPLAEVPRLVTVELLVETGRIVARDMRDRFGIAKPRLAFAGLNPHAGEKGALGAEDEAVVRPAVDALRDAGIDARGPLPADTLFHPEARATYDVAIGMYHDQVLIPAKTLAFHDGVNVTLGLPFVRTSPDHGTAFDIAGTGKADPSSLIAALKLARRLSTADAAARAPERAGA
ncbi:4-hydroxythreonine-4-phosphate dehydrogenase PdxA [Aquabacter spiritensis]|uniref:4-hydroxythreonine-4-phosphate dehydrogenase n=1 Tax=Aquabacter spiritensis TaxID=933073 RepID=A0A4R3M1Q4_9HYPH|nr:4-hydroxythreonine-4-phosphate dehydrogenase PdxA [Aquabacter spiritensis]TCT05087.1 4-hydroxythreonine-4-phosphate dehydrogenase [Aquabacter spiritensis]